jgi:ubiquinone/menaquinone biosynthesis C-methylase UbiE
MSKIATTIKRRLILYRLLQRVYYGIRRMMETYILGTKIQEWVWKTRHLYNGCSWIKGYCESINHPHRQWLIDTISSYTPFESILEIGCNTGPNLYLISKKFPQTRIYGIDINQRAIKEGLVWLHQEGVKNVLLTVSRADHLEHFFDKSIDIVFTDATLLYIGPDKIQKVLKEMARIARKALIFNEWHFEKDLKKPKGYFYYDGHWVYNYKALFTDYVLMGSIKVSKLPRDLWGGPGWEEFGSMIEVKL